MQDYEKMPDAKKNRNSVSSLLIEMPGVNTVKENKDHFIKRGGIQALCDSCAATALFTLQTNAPAGGAGNRVGLRGGGPLTTLLRPRKIDSLLWDKLWVNILTQERFAPSLQTADPRVFPWMATTRYSDQNGGKTFPEDMHLLHPYWGMPRRIWLIEKEAEEQRCGICGMKTPVIVEQYVAIKHGFDYGDTWIHPLTPYSFDANKEKPPLSIKGQKGGLSYKNWLGIALNRVQEGNCCANIVKDYFQKVQETEIDSHAGIWCFGYDMDNMKARCWYEHEFPLFALDETSLDRFRPMVENLLEMSTQGLKLLKSQIKSAWFSRPGDAKGDLTMIDATFLDRTEHLFHELVATLSMVDFTRRGTLPEELAVYEQWVGFLRKNMVDIFDSMALAGETDGLDMKRVIMARHGLLKRMRSEKIFKEMDKILSQGDVKDQKGKDQELKSEKQQDLK